MKTLSRLCGIGHFGGSDDVLAEGSCGDVPNRLDVTEGWNFLMRVYRPGPAVPDGTYKLPEAVAAG